ncbi:glycosyltransferase [Xanthomonas sp. AmX2]|uniref:CgeB family protein n=1 Tax=Xanthomonas sp. TaxID=29446 RepID=UPI00197FEB3D|nr:glycosyltransferase [Xanthomonas sp.]MBN6149434.1 glycosyltransferase [Xanthomonas sp.]
MGARDIVILGLSLRSSWGNGHATTFRALVDALQAQGDRVLFLERDVPWYADNQDAAHELPCEPALYASLDELHDRYADAVAAADLVIVGSYVPDGIAVGAWAQRTARGVVAFYDIDTPVTLAALERGRCEYLSPALIPRYDLYLSFTGGPTLQRLEQRYGAPRALPLYCAFDPARYYPQAQPAQHDLGYMGTYSDDRQPVLERLLLQPARDWRDGRFVVAGPMYPPTIEWPGNVERIEHLPPARHRDFYNRQRFTLNVTRADMVAAGWSPSVRLFEAAACATPIISDAWDGLEELFEPGKEILIARSAEQVVGWLRDMPEAQRQAIGQGARRRVLAEHTAAHRAQALRHYLDLAARPARSSQPREYAA